MLNTLLLLMLNLINKKYIFNPFFLIGTFLFFNDFEPIRIRNIFKRSNKSNMNNNIIIYHIILKI